MKLTIKTPAQWRKERRVEWGQDPDEDTTRKNIILGVPAAQTKRALERSIGQADDVPF